METTEKLHLNFDGTSKNVLLVYSSFSDLINLETTTHRIKFPDIVLDTGCSFIVSVRALKLKKVCNIAFLNASTYYRRFL